MVLDLDKLLHRISTPNLVVISAACLALASLRFLTDALVEAENVRLGARFLTFAPFVLACALLGIALARLLRAAGDRRNPGSQKRP